MKNVIKLMKLSLILTLFAGWSLTAMAQGGPPPPPPSGGHGSTGNQPAGPGGGAPIGTAVTLMLGLFGAYGAKKAWDNRKRLDE
ncbi:hypothetical protein MASR1M74_24100 [Lentimicrobium sp.]